MKRYVLPLILLSAISCRQKVDPGYVGVIVSLSGDSKGVHETVVGVGKYYISYNEDLYLFPTFTKTYPWTKSATEGSPTDESISFQTKEGLIVNGDFGITLSIQPDKAAVLFQKYRRQIDEIIDSVMRNLVRDALISEASKMGIEDLISSGKVGMMEKVTAQVREAVKNNGINVEKVYIIGEFRLPDSVKAAIDAKIKATQDAIAVENKLRQTEAEAKQKVVAAKAEGEALLARAEAEAKANKLLSQSLDSNLVQKMYIEKWNGVLPTYSGTNPLLMFGK